MDMSAEGIEQFLRSCYGLHPRRVERLIRSSPNAVWRVRADEGEFALKRLGREAAPTWLDFQRAATDRAAICGIPVERLVSSVDGRTTIEAGNEQWQLRRYVPGRSMTDGALPDLRAAGAFIAALHAVPLDGLLAGGNPVQDMEYWLAADEPGLDELAATVVRCTSIETWERLGTAYRDAYRRARGELDWPLYDALPKVLTHGELAGSNLVFGPDGTLVGVLDWDGVDVRPRVYDLARASLFLARTARGAFTVDHDLVLELLRSASGGSYPSPPELAAITPILELYCVPTARYVAQLAARSPETLEWYLAWSAGGAATVRDVMRPALTAVGLAT